jgi:hypothetical protein
MRGSVLGSRCAVTHWVCNPLIRSGVDGNLTINCKEMFGPSCWATILRARRRNTDWLAVDSRLRSAECCWSGNNVTARKCSRFSGVQHTGEHVRPTNRTIIIYFYRIDGHPERIPLTDGTLAKAVLRIQRVFHMSDGLYTKAEICRGNELIETMENHSTVRVASILLQ